MSRRTDRPMVAVVGPTGSGKSSLAIAIAAAFGGEIINCDSLQIYRHFNIGSAKLSPEERQGIAHHLIDAADPDEIVTAGDYAVRARAVLGEIAARGRLAVVVGGTGFYLRALLDGLAPGPPGDRWLRAVLQTREKRRSGILHRLLRRVDPPSAARIHPRDIQKLIRAVEVSLLAGKGSLGAPGEGSDTARAIRFGGQRRGERRVLSDVLAQPRNALRGYAPIRIGLNPDRRLLYRRLDERCRYMFEHGLLEEVGRILSLGVSPHVKPFESIGYRQALEVLQGRRGLEDAVEEAQRETRRYAKRQWTWFRREPDIHWLDGFGDLPDIRDQALHWVRTHLPGPGGPDAAPAPDGLSPAGPLRTH